MSAIANAYTELAGALEAGGVKKSTHFVPDPLVPPLVVIGSDDTFLVPSGTYNSSEFTLNAELWVIVKPTPNRVALESLFTLLETTLAALDDTDWQVSTIDPPTMEAYGQSVFLAIRVGVNSLIEIGVD